MYICIKGLSCYGKTIEAVKKKRTIDIQSVKISNIPEVIDRLGSAKKVKNKSHAIISLTELMNFHCRFCGFFVFLNQVKL